MLHINHLLNHSLTIYLDNFILALDTPSTNAPGRVMGWERKLSAGRQAHIVTEFQRPMPHST